mgnify:CR=1 FL=1
MKEKAKTEQEMREAEVPPIKVAEELSNYINSLVDREHDYGTCVYAMSMAAVAAFRYVASRLGATGFQASCADLDILERTRSMKMGFRIINYENLLYPQYLNSAHFPTHKQIQEDNKVELAKEARRKLAEGGLVHPEIEARWRYMASLSKED